VPATGTVDVELYTNLQLAVNGIRQEALDLIPNSFIPQHGKEDLSEQFCYRYGVTADGLHSMFVCVFAKSAVAVIQPSCVELVDEDSDHGLAENNSSEASTTSCAASSTLP
jgi:hypothetical protein